MNQFKFKMNFILLALFCFIFISECSLTLQEYPEYELQTPQLIFDQIQSTNQIQHPQIQKLVFITPWNIKGKQLTLKYSHKVTYVSPCWYQLVVKNNKIIFENQNLFDQEYYNKINQTSIKILPRVYLKDFEVIRLIGSNKSKFEQSIELLLKLSNKFDGIVWDSPFNTFSDDKRAQQLNRFIIEFVNQLKEQYNKQNKDFLLFFNMGNPASRNIQSSLYKQLKIDGLLIQNYDSPLNFVQMVQKSSQWIKSTKLQIKRIIMMLPLFSYKNNQGFNTNDVAQQLKNDGISFSGFDRQICKFISQTRNTYHVPCYKYFKDVYQIIKENQYAAGYWEGGNGIENYYLFM